MTETSKSSKVTSDELNKFKHFFYFSHDLCCIADMKGYFEIVNHNWEKVLGYSNDELVGRHFMEFIHPEDVAPTLKEVEALEAGAVSLSFINRCLTKEGKIVWFEWNGSRDTNTGKLYASARDITKRKEDHETKTRDKEYFLKELQRVAFIGSYKADFLVNSWESSEILDQIFGIDKKFPRTIQSWLDIVHPDDREMMGRYLQEEVILKRKPFNKEYRIIRISDGETRWVSGLGESIFDTKGNMITLIGTIQDITERKQAENELRESEETFRRVFNESADPVLLLDDTGFIDCNHAAISIFGYTAKRELINVKPWDVSPEKQPDGLSSATKARTMIAKAVEQGYNRFEWMHMKHDGTVFPAEVMLTPIILKGRQVFFSVVRDITARKQTEREKAEYLEKLIISEKQIREFARHLNQVLEDERAHIAREVHDELGQQLSGIKIKLSSLKNSGPDPFSAEGYSEKISGMMMEVDNTIQSLRKIATELRPGILDTLGLVPSVEWLAEEYQKRTGILCHVHMNTIDQKFEKNISTCFFRICQEVLTNVSKHAEASEINISIFQDEKELQMEIADNGKGIDLEKLGNPFSLGLLGMRERANIIGADLKIKSKKGEGTKVTLVAGLG